VGNTKFDQSVPELSAEAAAAVRAFFGWDAERPLWIAGSTHPGEEEEILEAYRTVLRDVPELALLIAPRHVERADEIEALIRARRMEVVRRTAEGQGSRVKGPVAHRVRDPASTLDPRPSTLDPTVALLDTVGELAGFYGLASVVFVGGSLVPKGGHDILQPLFHGKPTL
jgi:3-deoxy-D-manno-octulosonic-acid transferase